MMLRSAHLVSAPLPSPLPASACCSRPLAPAHHGAVGRLGLTTMGDEDPGAIYLHARRNRLQYNGSWEAFQANPEASAFVALLREAGQQYIKWATSTKERRAFLTVRFIKMHTSGDWKAYQGREFSSDHLLGRWPMTRRPY